MKTLEEEIQYNEETYGETTDPDGNVVPRERATCGGCGRSFPDVFPSPRCPYEYFHEEEVKEVELRVIWEPESEPDFSYLEQEEFDGVEADNLQALMARVVWVQTCDLDCEHELELGTLGNIHFGENDRVQEGSFASDHEYEVEYQGIVSAELVEDARAELEKKGMVVAS